MDRALAALQREFSEAGKAAQFETLKPWLVGDTPATSQADAARQLDLTEGAVKVTIHRLRKRSAMWSVLRLRKRCATRRKWTKSSAI